MNFELVEYIKEKNITVWYKDKKCKVIECYRDNYSGNYVDIKIGDNIECIRVSMHTLSLNKSKEINQKVSKEEYAKSWFWAGEYAKEKAMVLLKQADELQKIVTSLRLQAEDLKSISYQNLEENE